MVEHADHPVRLSVYLGDTKHFLRIDVKPNLDFTKIKFYKQTGEEEVA